MASLPVAFALQAPLRAAVEAAQSDPSRDALFEQWLDTCPICAAGLAVVVAGQRHDLDASGFDVSVEGVPMEDVPVECLACDFRCSLADVTLG